MMEGDNIQTGGMENLKNLRYAPYRIYISEHMLTILSLLVFQRHISLTTNLTLYLIIDI